MTLATGGTVTDIEQGGLFYRVHTFLTSDDLVVTEGGDVEYLIVGGGGGGGRDGGAGGGGGGGGVASGEASVSAGTFSIVVGSGGTKANASSTPGGTGVTSSFNAVSASGGLGGDGGTGLGGVGGDSGAPTTFTGGSNNVGASGDARSGGGGAGASQNGGNASIVSTLGRGGTGGDGLASTISNVSVVYAGGGGGGTRPGGYVAPGGAGGGGNGGDFTGVNATDGTNGLGGGGGGGASNISAAGDGGDGIVIIRYILSPALKPRVLIGGVNFTGNTVGEVTVSRGRRTVYERTNAGFASIDLIDVTGIPAFAVGDEVKVELALTDPFSQTFAKTVFTGILSDWSSETTPARDRPIVRYRLQAVGPLATLNRRQILFDGRTSENDAERVEATLIAALGTANVDTNLIDPGVFTLAALGSADAGYNALTTAQNAEFSGEGLLFETEDGNIGYQDADRRRTNERTEILTIPFATLSAEGIQVLQQLADITNTVTVSYEGGAVTELDQGSIDTFGLFETELSTQLVNLSNAENRAENFLSQHSVPSRNLEELRFRLRGVADDTLRDALLDVAVSDALEVTGVPEPVGFTQFRGFVEGVRLTVNDFDARLSLTVSDRRLSIAAERWGQVLGTIEWQNVDAALTWQDATEVTE